MQTFFCDIHRSQYRLPFSSRPMGIRGRYAQLQDSSCVGKREAYRSLFRHWMLGASVVGAILLVTPSLSYANDTANVRQVLQLSNRDQWTAAQDVARRSGRLTAAIYEWLVLQREDMAQPFERYTAFLDLYADWPYSRRIRAGAERVMPGTMPPESIVAFFKRNDPVTVRGISMYVRALSGIGQEGQARKILNDWFRNAAMTATEQTQMMDAWRNQLDSATSRARLDRLIGAGEEKMAKELARTMGNGYPELVVARLALASRAKDAPGTLARVPAKLMNDPGLMYDRIRYQRRTDKLSNALDLFNRLPQQFEPYDSRVFWNEQQTLVYAMLDQRDFVRAYQIATKTMHEDRAARAQSEWLAGHVALVYLKQPGRAFRHFETLYNMASSPLTRARAAYWAARASDMLRYPDVAMAWYRTAATYRGNFYGQMAALKLPKGAQVLRQGPPVATVEDKQRFDASSLVQAARLFHAVGDNTRAQLFLNRLADVNKGNGAMVRLTVDLAVDMKILGTAMRISRESGSDGIDFADYVYPTLSNFDTGDVERALVYAVIRQESGFDPTVTSSAGASGLMQLMPSTAKAVAKKEGRSHQHEWLISKPDHNVKLGSAYLKHLIERYNGNYAMAAAAYNAGPSRVAQWIAAYGDPRQGDISLVDWIERIPFNETRNYVQRVLEGTAIYRQKLKTPTSGLDPMHLK